MYSFLYVIGRLNRRVVFKNKILLYETVLLKAGKILFFFLCVGREVIGFDCYRNLLSC